MAQDTQTDFFISYNKADHEWAEWIAGQLEEAGYTTIIQAWDFRPGGNFMLEMHGAIKGTKRTIAVLSPNYLAQEARFSALEWTAALHSGRLLPVCVRECDVEGLLGPITYIDLMKVDEQMARDTLLAGVQPERAKRVVAFPRRTQDVGEERVLFPGRPFMVEDLPGDFVQRPAEFEKLIGKLLDEGRERPVAITAALRGAGGYGKTTMARALCHDERVRRAFRDGILWVTLGENVALEKLVGKVEDVIYTLSHERPGFTGLDAATTRLVELLADRDMLLVIDDVWDGMHLKPFLQGGRRCARLVTTRDEGVLPAETQRIAVDAMEQGEAVQLLRAGLDGALRMEEGSSIVDPHQRRPQGSPPHIPVAPASTRYDGRVPQLPASEGDALRRLAIRLGEWPLLLKLANGVLRERVGKYKQGLPDALTYINKALDRRGVIAFDGRNVQDRNQAVAQTLGVSLELLSQDDYARYRELAVFPEDVDIPLVTLEKLWGMTGRLDDVDTEALCARLHGLSLLLNCELVGRTIRLHDVVRGYLRSEVGGEGLAVLDGQLLDAYGQKRWADIPQGEPYVWEHLAEHLVGAGRGEELVATVKDLRYLATKAQVRSASAAEADLIVAEQQAPSDVVLRLLKRNVARMSHVLSHCETLHEIEIVLHSRLCHLDELADMCRVLEGEMSRPFLTSWHTLPDLPHPALIRTLQGHAGAVRGCAVSPAGDFIVSASGDNTLKVWDAHSGEVRLTLQGHAWPVTGCAVSPAGDYIVSASSDNTLKVWDACSGEVRLTLQGHAGAVRGCAVSPAGDYIVSASSDNTLKVWDAHSGEVRLTLKGHRGAVTGCAVSPAGNFIVSASSDNTLKVWDAHSGEVRLTLRGHTDWVRGCAVSPAGDFIVSASDDKTLKVWDVHSGEVRFTLQGHAGAVHGCAASPAGDFIVSASEDTTLKVWNAHSGGVCLTLEGHTHWVTGCAVSPAGDFIVSASRDTTLKVWDACSGEVRLTLQGHTDGVYGCAVSPAGDFIVSASEDKTLKVWDAQSGEVRLTLQGHMSRVTGCAVSPAGDIIVSASLDGMLKVWDACTGVRLATLLVDGSLYGCACHPDGEHVVTVGDGGVYFLRWVR